jgi:transcriptional regulator with XRE-family HTH domain
LDIKTKVGNRIRKLREKKGISQEELGLISDIDRTYINSVENGKRNISIVNLEKISLALDKPLREFFNDKLFE